ncbi:MAG: tRNA pseudouridine synthase B [Porticoccaceae bacterium]|nr:MAG: tRNA pseudouridine synthase B [Porticoccaceae bacterium]
MGRRRPKGRPVDGILILDKPPGLTSNEALQRVRHLFFAAKAGHTGSLDPLATGVLPVCFGEATKFSQFLLDADKGYRATFRFGITTRTGDAEGPETGRVDASGLTREAVEAALPAFRGEILQVPSMYSAVKQGGRPLYELARAGVEVERAARPVRIHRFALLDFRPGLHPEADFELLCSKGTYVRTLAEDLGRALGVGAHVIRLHRHRVGVFGDEDAIALAELERLREGRRAEELDGLLLPVERAVAHLLAVELDGRTAWFLRRGQPVMAAGAYRHAREGDIVRILDEAGHFLGVGEVLEDGRLAPRRLVVGAGF